MTFPHGSTAMAWPHDRRKLPSSLCWPAFWAQKLLHADFEGQQKWGINRLWQDHHQKSELHPWKLNILNTIRFGRWVSFCRWVSFKLQRWIFSGVSLYTVHLKKCVGVDVVWWDQKLFMGICKFLLGPPLNPCSLWITIYGICPMNIWDFMEILLGPSILLEWMHSWEFMGFP